MKNTMRLVAMVVMALSMLMVLPATVTAQTDKQQKKENKEWQKKQEELRKFVNEKAGKEAQKQAKKLEKAGWKSIGLPIAKQLEQTWMKMAEEDATGFPRYIYAPEEATANTYATAQSSADNVAKLRIASQISSSIHELVDIALANQQINEKEANSYHKITDNAKVLVQQKLGRTFKTKEIYRVLSNGNYQVQVVMFYDMKAAVEIAREVMLEELKKDSDVNKAQLESLLGMDKLTEQVSKDLPTYDEVVK